MTTILEDRAAKLPTIELALGNHSSFSKGACAMELASWLAGEPWSDHPDCVCPVIGAFMRNWNDNLPDDTRTAILLPLITKTIGTRGSKALEARRSTMAADWYVRVFTPAWLRLAGLTEHADALAAFPEITSFEKTPSIRAALEAASKDATAAWTAAGTAAEQAMAPTVADLQVSAVALVERLCALSDADLAKAA